MLLPICLILLTSWLIGLVIGYTTGYFIHIPLLFAVIAVLTQIVNDYRDDGPVHARLRPLQRQLIRRFGKILPRLVRVPGENIPHAIRSSRAYGKEQPK